MPAATGQDLQALAAQVERLLDEFRDGTDPRASELAEELVRALVAMYGLGLERLLDVLRAYDQADSGAIGEVSLVRRLADDDVVGHLLALHDLHPDDVDTRIQQALDGVRPYLGSHAGGIRHDGVDENGVAHLTLEGTCDGCPSSSVTVKLTVERAILDVAPEVVAVDVQGMVAQDPQLLQIQPRPVADGGPPSAADGWVHLQLDVRPGQVSRRQVGDVPVLVCVLGGTPYAYRDACPRCDSELSKGTLDGGVLTCSSCRAAYDVRLAGRSLTGPEPSLDPVPLLPDGAGWKAAVPGGVLA